ncbi:storkhead-box protein 1 isoform X2 [Haemorhous mexicanus]|nr:storkhead-box protein 1 isoform X2 [Haemorhous mexicanus]XP_059706847.1 storkhead-box protein 1 isoform X2 [Haemorhous mexicanus]XP_059706848.1 storkhead-box protein 1 isoform X2 [Haemorhous mexicanus]XP_059706849.1 storkhead-box protein 1 isoform X2 [Haemorhous mexicanus]XP_059706850.1 storkhead-box protein 1 isoform X2 [Haemorhous mexicanus]
MNPLSQPRSVPLAEAICWAISDMNAHHVVVTQETLMEQLVKNYPGIAVPSHNELYNILGTLIKERKIYHTGEGYFIVTPNTYFITNDATEDSRRILLEDSCCCSSPSITDLVNIKACADLVKESIPTVPCYRSCHCFPDQNMPCEQRQGQGMSHGSTGEEQRGCSELKPSIQTQGLSASAENHSWDTIKSLISVKAKLKSKMFGLGLFWRSGSKKQKHKKEYSTFSGQFPPQEWPVRDEDDLNNMPRDIEHEIIKRINPTLTVDNLIKHTILMQKFEEQKKCSSKEKKHISNGTSAEVPTLRQNHLSKDCIQRASSKTAKHTRKNKSKREKQMSRSSRKSHRQKLTSQNMKLEESFSLPIKTQGPPAAAVESQVIYKKQIRNPFQGLPWRPCSFPARGHQGGANSQLKCQTQKGGRVYQRPQSLASSGPFGCETERLGAESEAGKAKPNNLLHANRSDLQLKKDSLSENGSYPQGSNLQIDNRSRYFLESNISEENVYKRTVKKKSPCSYIEDNGVCQEDAKFPSSLKDEHCRCKAATVGELLDQTASDFQNVHLSNYTASVNLTPKNGVKYRPKTDKKSELIFNHECASHPGSRELEREGFTANSHLLYQKGHDGDTCPLSHLHENSEQLPPGHALSATGDWSTAVSLKASEVSTCPAQQDTTVNKCEMRHKGSASLADGSKEHPKPASTEESWLCSQVLLKGHRKDEGTGLSECGKGSAGAECCQAGSDAGTLQNFTPEVGEGAARCALGSGIKGVRNPPGQKEHFVKSTCPVSPEQKHPEGTENHSNTGDSGIDSPRWTEKKMNLPAKF